MTTQNRFKPGLCLIAIFLVLFLFPACAPTPTPALFIPPKAATSTQPLLLGETPVIFTSTPILEPTPSPTATPPCTDGLAFVDDITIPDDTVVSPGASVDKRWLVQNNGTCNWDADYRLKFVGGLEMGAPLEQALYPARGGAQATIRITFTAPTEPGEYTTSWQAINPDGEPFGDAIFMTIQVSP